MITENDLVQDNGVERDVVPKQSDKQLIDNVIKDVKIPGMLIKKVALMSNSLIAP